MAGPLNFEAMVRSARAHTPIRAPASPAPAPVIQRPTSTSSAPATPAVRTVEQISKAQSGGGDVTDEATGTAQAATPAVSRVSPALLSMLNSGRRVAPAPPSPSQQTPGSVKVSSAATLSAEMNDAFKSRQKMPSVAALNTMMRVLVRLVARPGLNADNKDVQERLVELLHYVEDGASQVERALSDVAGRPLVPAEKVLLRNGLADRVADLDETDGMDIYPYFLDAMTAAIRNPEVEALVSSMGQKAWLEPSCASETTDLLRISCVRACEDLFDALVAPAAKASGLAADRDPAIVAGDLLRAILVQVEAEDTGMTSPKARGQAQQGSLGRLTKLVCAECAAEAQRFKPQAEPVDDDEYLNRMASIINASVLAMNFARTGAESMTRRVEHSAVIHVDASAAQRLGLGY